MELSRAKREEYGAMGGSVILLFWGGGPLGLRVELCAGVTGSRDSGVRFVSES